MARPQNPILTAEPPRLKDTAFVVVVRRAIVKTSVEFMRAQPVGAIAFAVIIAILMAAILAPWVAPFGPLAIDHDRLSQAPGWPYLAGTDNFGRDVLSRIIYGAQVSLLVALGALSVSVLLGLGIGLISGYFLGTLDLIIQRVLDAFLSFPALILALALVAVLGPSQLNVVVAISAVYTPRVARVVRASTIGVKQQPYVEAARATGASTARILVSHVTPNIMAPLIIIATTNLGQAILLEASLSFLGLGVPPPSPSWGNMLTGHTLILILQAPWALVAPGIAISVTVMAFNLFGDALRDVLDPRLRDR